MKSFAEFATASKPRTNLHMTHIDESLFEGGEQSAENAIDALLSIVEGSDDYRLTVKYDGAPAIFAGTDPADGKFFVGTKSVFNKSPKLYKTFEDITANEKGGKADKLLEALRLLPGLGIPKDTVLQGDLLWTKGDHQYLTYEDRRYVVVHPNTLMYGWLSESDEGKAVRNAELGIVFHTTYRGRGELSNYQATFGANVSKLNQVREVWVSDAQYGDIEPSDASTSHAVRSALIEARENICEIDEVVNVMNTIPSSASGANIKTFYNTCIREGFYPESDFFDDYVSYVKNYWEGKVVESVKTDSAKDKKKLQLKQLLADIRMRERVFHNAFYYTQKLNEVKCMVIDMLNEMSSQKVFVNYDGVVLESQHEGYVAINSKTGEAFKLVDRVTFSHNNFSEAVSKGW